MTDIAADPDRMLKIGIMRPINKEQFHALQKANLLGGRMYWMPFVRLVGLHKSKLIGPLLVNLTPKKIPTYVAMALNANRRP